MLTITLLSSLSPPIFPEPKGRSLPASSSAPLLPPAGRLLTEAGSHRGAERRSSSCASLRCVRCVQQGPGGAARLFEEQTTPVERRNTQHNSAGRRDAQQSKTQRIKEETIF